MKILKYGERYGAPTVLAMGFFDCVHLGHAAIIREAERMARELGAQCAVFTFSNDPGSFLNKKKQLYSLKERTEVFSALGADAVVTAEFDKDFYATTAEEFLTKLIASGELAGVVAGEDYTFGARALGDARMLCDFMRGAGKAVSVLDLERMGGVKISSTGIKNAVERGDIGYANARLTEPYFMLGTVSHAHGRGSTFGYPTANIPFDTERLSPAEGVYAVKATVDGRTYIGGTNVGTKPTFGDERPSVETYMLDFDGDIYGKEMKLAFYKRIRGVTKFASAQALAARLDADMRGIREYFSEEMQ